ncbi:hypothetical protein A9Q91_02685 [Candidatus Gracilibacteria bacterium 28_42_T64]|nr:hypothetical protein A9Q91_02685 [Candidatus Gracilibacteria bacterium 28_42_T64]
MNNKTSNIDNTGDAIRTKIAEYRRVSHERDEKRMKNAMKHGVHSFGTRFYQSKGFMYSLLFIVSTIAFPLLYLLFTGK